MLADWRPVGFFGDAVYAVHPWSSTTPRPLKLLIGYLKERLARGFGGGGDGLTAGVAVRKRKQAE